MPLAILLTFGFFENPVNTEITIPMIIGKKTVGSHAIGGQLATVRSLNKTSQYKR